MVVDVEVCVVFTVPVPVPVVVPVVVLVEVPVPVPVTVAVDDVDVDVDAGASVEGGTSVAEPHTCATQIPKKSRVADILDEVHISNIGFENQLGINTRGIVRRCSAMARVDWRLERACSNTIQRTIILLSKDLNR